MANADPATQRVAEYGSTMRLYALVEAGDPEAIDVFVRRDDAEAALEDCLSDESEWRGLLRVEAVELSADFVSPN